MTQGQTNPGSALPHRGSAPRTDAEPLEVRFASGAERALGRRLMERVLLRDFGWRVTLTDAQHAAGVVDPLDDPDPMMIAVQGDRLLGAAYIGPLAPATTAADTRAHYRLDAIFADPAIGAIGQVRKMCIEAGARSARDGRAGPPGMTAE